MKARSSVVVVLAAWMIGTLFSLWLSTNAKLIAQAAVEMGPTPWTAFLVGIPWVIVWLSLSVILGLLAWAALAISKRVSWAAYAYAAVVVVVLAVAYWAAVVIPMNGVLANPL